jgi:hypothetical protein
MSVETMTCCRACVCGPTAISGFSRVDVYTPEAYLPAFVSIQVVRLDRAANLRARYWRLLAARGFVESQCNQRTIEPIAENTAALGEGPPIIGYSS